MATSCSRAASFRVALLAIASVLAFASEGSARSEGWAADLLTFQKNWKFRSGDLRAGALRDMRRKGLQVLGQSRDARAVPYLLAAHKKEVKIAGRLKKSEPMYVSRYFDAMAEEELAGSARMAMAQLINSLKEDEKGRALGLILREAGSGGTAFKDLFVRLLGHVPDERATQRLLVCAEAKNPQTMIAALVALGRSGTAVGRKRLHAALTDPRWRVRLAAYQGLALHPDAATVDLLMGKAKEERGAARCGCFALIGALLGEDSPQAIEEWDSYWSEEENRKRIVAHWQRPQAEDPDLKEYAPIRHVSKNPTMSILDLKIESRSVVFVVDLSGARGDPSSMGPGDPALVSRVANAISAAIEGLAQKEPDAEPAVFNIVSCKQTPTVFQKGMCQASKSNAARAVRWVKALAGVEYWRSFSGLVRAFTLSRAATNWAQLEGRADTVVLFSDAAPAWGGIFKSRLQLGAIRQLNRERFLVLHTVGLGESYASRYLESLARQNAGEYVGD